MWREQSTYKIFKWRKILKKYQDHFSIGVPCMFTHDDGNQESMLICKNRSPDYLCVILRISNETKSRNSGFE